MGDFDPAFVQSLARQSWSLYSVGMFLILLRLYARIHRLGFRGLQTDDYLMIQAGGLYTMLIVCLNVISGGGGSNLYLPEDFDTFTAQDIKERIKGSKIVLVSEQAMLNVIYTIKACMLIMYTRLTLGLNTQKMVRYLSIYVVVGWVSTQIAFFTACTPFKGYWAMPPPDPQCTTLQHYAIIQGCFNISSDVLMLCIPLPLITRLHLPWRQKAVLMVIFSMGTFVIVAAILTKVFNLSNIWDPSYMLWYTRESSVAVYVSNLPMIWPLLREWFPNVLTFTTGQKASGSAEQGFSGKQSSRQRSSPVSSHYLSGGLAGRRLSDNRVTTTIQCKGGESTEELSSGTDTEMELMRQGSWDETVPPTARSGIVSTGGWDRELTKGGIHLSTTVKVSVTEPTPAHQTRDLEKGAGRFHWNGVQGNNVNEKMDGNGKGKGDGNGNGNADGGSRGPESRRGSWGRNL